MFHRMIGRTPALLAIAAVFMLACGDENDVDGTATLSCQSDAECSLSMFDDREVEDKWLSCCPRARCAMSVCELDCKEDPDG